MLASVALSLTLGTIGFWVGLSELIEHNLAGNAITRPFSFEHRLPPLWMEPTEGRIIGEVIQLEESALGLKDINQENWVIHIESVPPENRSFIEIGSSVRAIGELTGDHDFTACDILPGTRRPIPPPQKLNERKIIEQRNTKCRPTEKNK